MPLKLIGKAVEKSNVGVEWTFTADDGSEPDITSLSWTLTNLDGDVINGREDEAVDEPAAENTIVLSGDDLALEDQDNDYEIRIMTIYATYDPKTGRMIIRFARAQSFRFII